LFVEILELSAKYSKESTKTLCLFKTRNKVVEVCSKLGINWLKWGEYADRG
jgi:hypothetical protein